MKKYFFLISFSFLFIFSSLAEHQNEPYEPHNWDKFLVNGSDKYYKFESNLIEDKSVKKEIKNTKKTGLISYLLYEDNKIKIDEENLPEYIKSNNGIMPSHSVGKSLVSYVLGHAICEGYIDSINITLDDIHLISFAAFITRQTIVKFGKSFLSAAFIATCTLLISSL